jgi:hypothetical protein
MKRGYVYRRPVKRSHYSNFRRQMFISFLFLAAFAAVGYFIYTGLHRQPAKPATSTVENTQITGSKQTFFNDYFQFEDTDKWVIKKDETNASKITYVKFRKNQQLAEMIVYMNQVPAVLNLAVPRVVPVKIVNNNSLDANSVSDPCVKTYAKGELHKVKEVTISNTTMLCDPDSPQYYMIFGEMNGDYRLNLRLSDGKPVQFIITYKDTGLNPLPDAPLNIANSFKTR